ncbi:hypothetical protein [Aeoliella sp. SH292]|uniref:hypothetical protein n=1 Tax=Aeoliella sp. SH292 TaxID=3454464 RepID=UPI003F968AA1
MADTEVPVSVLIDLGNSCLALINPQIWTFDQYQDAIEVVERTAGQCEFAATAALAADFRRRKIIVYEHNRRITPEESLRLQEYARGVSLTSISESTSVTAILCRDQ